MVDDSRLRQGTQILDEKHVAVAHQREFRVRNDICVVVGSPYIWFPSTSTLASNGTRLVQWSTG